MASLMSKKQHRKLAREAVLQALYAKHVSNENEKKVLYDINERYQFDKPTKKFVNELFKHFFFFFFFVSLWRNLRSSWFVYHFFL